MIGVHSSKRFSKINYSATQVTTHPTMSTEAECPFQDVEDPTKPWTHVAKTEVMLDFHVEAKHHKHSAEKKEKGRKQT